MDDVIRKINISEYLFPLQATNSSQPSKTKIDGLNQLPALVDKAKEGPRTSVHIHRDYDRDGHAYRRGPWKVRKGFRFFLFLVSR